MTMKRYSLKEKKRKRKSYHSTLSASKWVCGQGLSRGLVKKRDASVRENAAKTTVPLYLKPAKRKRDEKDELVSVKRVKKAKTPEKDKTEYSLRQSNLASCMNLEPSDDDHFLYCGVCKMEFEGDCPVHGPYNYFQDKEVPEGDPHSADHAVPDDLEIKTSNIFGAGLGVFSKVGLESRIMFGPYGGNTISDNPISGYCWQIYKEGKASHFVDAQKKATSNWMRYVNCAMTEADRNLLAFQYKGGLYYCTFKSVSPGEELLVWYGDEYTRELGIIRDKNLLLNLTAINTKLNSISNVKQNKSDISQSIRDKQLTSEILQMENLNNTDEKEYKGEGWNNTRNNSSNMKTNMRIQTGERLYKCEVCSYACTRSNNLKRHMRIHTGERDYKCGVCDYECNQSSTLKLHMRIHTGEKPYKCEVCGYACNQSGSFKKHMSIHTGEKEYKCEVCGYACNQSGSFKKHMSIHTGEREYKCEVCGYAFNRRFTLKTHMRIHTGEGLYRCEVCGNTFNQSGLLKRHMRIHTGERPYKCEVCDYACNQSGSLKTHMRIHTGEREYKCEVCGYECNQKSTLKTHMRIHTGERLYKCEVCGYEFNQSCNLKTHMKVHTGEKDYKCEVCGYECNQKSTLKTHMRIHTGEKPYKCEVCGKTFNQSGILKRHMRIHTGEKEQV